MRRIILFLGVILFFLTSCNENKTKNISHNKDIQVGSEVELVDSVGELEKQDILEQVEDLNDYDVTSESEAAFELFTLTVL